MSKLQFILLGRFECLLPSGERILLSMRKAEAHISALRKRLSSAGAPVLIKTRRGFGYLIE